MGGGAREQQRTSNPGGRVWGTRQQIRDHVKEVIDCLGSYGGGLIGHGEIAPDVPLANVRAMLEAWWEFWGY